MSERRADLIDEAVLRRALRLEPSEVPPRFDPAAIAAAARGARPNATVLAAGILVAAATGLAAAAIWTVLFDAAPTVVALVGDLLLGLVITIVTMLVPIAELASQPAVPLSLLAALAIAIASELRERKEHAHASAS